MVRADELAAPLFDVRGPPTDCAARQANGRGELLRSDEPVDRRAAQPGAATHGIHAKDLIRAL